MTACAFDGCDREAAKRGWCRAHYAQWRRTGKVWEFGSNPNRQRKPCVFPECGRLNFARGYCSAHAKQLRLGQELRPIREPRPADHDGLRWCSHCKQFKDLDTFPSQGNAERPSRTCDDCRAEAMRAYNTRPEVKMRTRWARAQKKYGITQEHYLTLWNQQDGKCSICSTQLEHILSSDADLRYKSAIDHDHETGAVRGLLCGACNCAIGYMQDDPIRLESAARYLRRFKE